MVPALRVRFWVTLLSLSEHHEESENSHTFLVGPGRESLRYHVYSTQHRAGPMIKGLKNCSFHSAFPSLPLPDLHTMGAKVAVTSVLMFCVTVGRNPIMICGCNQGYKGLSSQRPRCKAEHPDSEAQLRPGKPAATDNECVH